MAMMPKSTAKAESILMCLRLRFGRFVFVALAGLFASAVTLSTIIFPSLVLVFNNTYGLAVNKDIAKKYNLKTYSDLAKVSNNLIFGAEYDFFEREDGYKELQKVYNMNFKKQIDMDIGLKYQAMKDKKIDVMVIFTTDGQLAISDVVVLEDDKKMYPSYRAGTVIRSEILSEYPELKPVLEKLNNILDDKTMADLNYQVESEGKKPEDVAREYLQEKGLLEVKQ